MFLSSRSHKFEMSIKNVKGDDSIRVGFEKKNIRNSKEGSNLSPFVNISDKNKI